MSQALLTPAEGGAFFSKFAVNAAVEAPAGFDRAVEAASIAANDPWRPTFDRLDELRNLGDDWDGEGSPAPEGWAVPAAMTIARWLRRQNWAPPTHVSATVNGAIAFEWFDERGYGELEVIAPQEAEWRWLEKGASEAQSHAIRWEYSSP